MQTLNIRKQDGSPMCIDRQQLRDAITAPLVFPESSEYDASREIWNAMIDRKPSVIVQARFEADVSAAIGFAAGRQITIAIRSGGHNIAGTALCNDGMVIDLQAINHVEVNEAKRTAKVGPGATLADVDRATQAFGLVVPAGINSTTGIAGLTVGGGFGWTTRKFGLTVDNLRAVRVVTADGIACIASAQENPDLFWALRGGGGNFGVVTEFEFDLHFMGTQVFAGMSVHPLADAAPVVETYQALIADASDELTCWAVLRKAPPLPFVPAEWHGREVLVLAMCYIGAVENGEQATRALRDIGNPIAESVGPTSFVDWQKIFDPLLTEGARNYWKSHDVKVFSQQAISLIQAAVSDLPTDECEVFFGHIGGQAARRTTTETPWPNRAPHFAANVHTRWRDASEDERCISWARRLYDALTPHAMGTRYINFVAEGDGGSGQGFYGENFQRLASIKSKLDPTNLFQTNINIAG